MKIVAYLTCGLLMAISASMSVFSQTKADTIQFIAENLPSICRDKTTSTSLVAGKEVTYITTDRCYGFVFDEEKQLLSYTGIEEMRWNSSDGTRPGSFPPDRSKFVILLRKIGKFELKSAPTKVETVGGEFAVRNPGYWQLHQVARNVDDQKNIGQGIIVNEKEMGERIVKALNHLLTFIRPEAF